MEEEKKEEKIDLKKHRELFKILPDDEYKSLEEALEKGLYITPYGVEGEGKELLNVDENVIKGLPGFYDSIKKMGTLKEKQENIKTSGKSFKEYINVDNWSGYHDGVGKTLVVDVVVFLWGGLLSTGFAQMLGWPFLPTTMAVTLLLYPLIDGIPAGISKALTGKTYSPNGVIAGTALKGWNSLKKRRKDTLGRKIRKRKTKIVEEILKIKQGTVAPEEFNYVKNIDVIKDNDKLSEMFENKNKNLKEILEIILNKDVEEYKEKINYLTGLARKRCAELDLKKPDGITSFVDYCTKLGLDMPPIRKEIGKMGNRIFEAAKCPLVKPRAAPTQKPALDKELSGWINENGLASLDMFFEQPECIDDAMLHKKVRDISDSIVAFPEKEGAGKKDVEPLKEYYRTAKKAIEDVGKGLGCGDLLDDYDGLLLNSIMCGVELVYKNSRAKIFPTPPSHVPELKEENEPKQAEKKKKEEKRVLVPER